MKKRRYLQAFILNAIKHFCAWDGETLLINILETLSTKQDAINKPKGNQLKVSVTTARWWQAAPLII
ncbi:MAG: hypothetical protein ABL885_14880 [Methylophilaceae bacterium]